MDIKKAFETDAKLELEGVWIAIGDGAEVLVARLGNANYSKFFKKILKPHRREFRTGTMSDKVMDNVLIETMANTLLLGWREIYEGETPVEYSVENAIRILTEYPELRQIVAEIAGEMESFKVYDEEEASKNSERSSSGASTGESTTNS